MALLPLIRTVTLSAMLVVLAFAWQTTDLNAGDRGACRAWFLDVGQGDAEFIETPDGARVLIDGGADRSVLAKLGQLLPPWDRRIDAAILSHPDADHVIGLAAVLERYRVGVVYASGVRGRAAAAKAVEDASVKHVDVRAGDRLSIGGATFDVLAPSDARPGFVPDEANAFSVVVKLSCGGSSVLFEGDLPAARERSLATEHLHADVLKVSHHGSWSSSDPAFLDAVHPSAAVIEVGADNTFGQPHPAVLLRLGARGIRTYRTDLDGDVLFAASGGVWSLAPHPLPF